MKKTNRRDFLKHSTKYILGLGMMSGIPSIFAGCETMGNVAAISSSIAASTGLISQTQAESITKSAKAVAKTFEDITPEQEYYIGRTVSAVVLSKYKPYPSRRINEYINILGQSLAQVSDLPETFGGYHFLVLDSNDINAFAAPGGFIFVTRGLIRCCNNEDALAGVLAHEIGHVQFQHGLRSISTSRITTALTTIGMESAKTFGGQELANLTSVFEDSISDITQTMINNGYSRNLEYQADQAAVTIMTRLGYDSNGILEMLNSMKTKLKPGGLDFAKTHPSPDKRIAQVKKYIADYHAVKPYGKRQARFQAALRNI